MALSLDKPLDFRIDVNDIVCARGTAKLIHTDPSGLYRNLLFFVVMLCQLYQMLAEISANSYVLVTPNSIGGLK